MADTIAVLRGGARDGQTTIVSDDVRRLRVASEAPGLVDVYESTGATEHVRGNQQPGVVFEFRSQEPMTDEHGQVLRLPATEGGEPLA